MRYRVGVGKAGFAFAGNATIARKADWPGWTTTANMLRRELFIVPTWYNPDFWVAYYDMYDHPEPLPPYALGHLDFWWYDADKAEALRAAGAFQ